MQYVANLTALENTPIKDGLEYGIRLRWQSTRPHLFFCPDHDPILQAIGLHQFGHELDLVDTRLQEEANERGKCCFAKVAAPIAATVTWTIAGMQMGFVTFLITGKTACN